MTWHGAKACPRLCKSYGCWPLWSMVDVFPISAACEKGINGHRRVHGLMFLGGFIAGSVISAVPQGWSQERVEGRELAHDHLEIRVIDYVSLYSSSSVITSRFLSAEVTGPMVWRDKAIS